MLFVIIAIATICYSYGRPTQKEIVIESVSRSEFEEFTDLFTLLSLPLSLDQIECSTTLIPGKLVKKFISPNDEEAENEIKSLGKFKISDKYIGVIFCYSTNLSGDLKELFVFDTSGNFQSELMVGVDYRTYYLKSTIDAAYNIQTEANQGEGIETEYHNYSIKNGMISRNK